MDFQEFLVYLVITVLMNPLLLVLGLPFILLGKLFHHFGALWFRDGPRFALACGIAALGIAPAYDEHRMPTPIYTWLMGWDIAGEASQLSLAAMLVSFGITWAIVWAKARKLAQKKH
ncbi:hypothetical protein [Paucibacter soli]|uniref:hypothetical protein n=1 Tax=Paucibacter soli TaxID=3133433 RepID=UPI0030A9731C